MATAAEPRPADLPLPGGREGATVTLHPLLTGTVKGPPAWFERIEGRMGALRAFGFGVKASDLLTVPVPAFLVEHPAAGPFLIDTGFHASVAVEPKQNLGRLSAFSFKGIEMNPGQAVEAQLRGRGIAPAQIGVVVMTHLHTDHASAISDFAGATFVVSAREWEAATNDGPFHGYVKRQFDHAFDFRTIDFDSAAVGSFATFGRAVDLFGDGSVRMVYTPGHTHGHCSVVLRLAERDVIVAGDAAYTARTLRGDAMPYRMEDEHRFRRSLREIQLFTEQAPDTLVIPGHDLDAWNGLEASYS